MQVTVAVAEGQDVLRYGLEAMLAAVPGVVSRAYETLDELVAGAADPDWARVGLVSGAALAAAGHDTRRRLARTAVLATVPSVAPVHVATAARSPADGYLVLADLSVESLGRAVRDVAAGRRHVPERLAPAIERWARAGAAGGNGRGHLLSPRESQVMELLVNGHSNKEISRLLGISIHSTKRHVSSILGKLDSPSRSHLVSSVLRGVVSLQEA